MSTTYRIEGMTCDGCVRSLTKALQTALPGREVEVTLDGGLARIDGEPDDATVEQAVEDAGFDYAGRAESASS
jgi:copper chaperone